MLSNVYCSLTTFGNTPKVDTKATMMKNKMKNLKSSWCIMSSLSKEKDIIVRGTQVLLDVDQRGHVKQKSSDLSSN